MGNYISVYMFKKKQLREFTTEIYEDEDSSI